MQLADHTRAKRVIKNEREREKARCHQAYPVELTGHPVRSINVLLTLRQGKHPLGPRAHRWKTEMSINTHRGRKGKERERDARAQEEEEEEEEEEE